MEQWELVGLLTRMSQVRILFLNPHNGDNGLATPRIWPPCINRFAILVNIDLSMVNCIIMTLELRTANDL